jgi:hypothetical protein
MFKMNTRNRTHDECRGNDDTRAEMPSDEKDVAPKSDTSTEERTRFERIHVLTWSSGFSEPSRHDWEKNTEAGCHENDEYSGNV